MKLIHYILYPTIFACVLVMSWLCHQWERMYDELQIEYAKATDPALVRHNVELIIFTSGNAMIRIDDQYVYRFQNVCRKEFL